MCIHNTSTVGAGLLAKAVGSAKKMLNVPPPSRVNPLPQGFFGGYRARIHTKSTVGASLLAMAS